MTAGTAFVTQSFTGAGGYPTYTYSVSAGSLPTGLSLSSTGWLTGTPSTAGPFNFTIQVVDSSTGSGPFSGTRVFSGTVAANAAPAASAVAITGTAQVGVPLSGSYTYSDAESNAQGSSTFRWVSNTVNTGAGGGTNVATTQTYTAVAGDQGKYLYFCVTPVASVGTTTGTEVCSSATAAVAVAAVNGVCAAVAPTVFMPSTGLCTQGTARSVTDASPWAWTCTGSGGGTTDNCTAPNASTSTSTGTGRASISGGTWVVDTANSGGFVATSTAPNPPPGYNFPHGLFDIKLISGSSGSTATVVITYPTALPANTVYWKYGREKGNPTAHWYRFDGAAILDNTITLTLTDGEKGDDDYTANGVITDPGGPGVPSGAAANNSIPTLSEWGLIFLSSLMVMFGLWQVRRRNV